MRCSHANGGGSTAVERVVRPKVIIPHPTVVPVVLNPVPAQPPPPPPARTATHALSATQPMHMQSQHLQQQHSVWPSYYPPPPPVAHVFAPYPPSQAFGSSSLHQHLASTAVNGSDVSAALHQLQKQFDDYKARVNRYVSRASKRFRAQSSDWLCGSFAFALRAGCSEVGFI